MRRSLFGAAIHVVFVEKSELVGLESLVGASSEGGGLEGLAASSSEGGGLDGLVRD